MFVTLDVLKLDKSRFVKPLQPKNIYIISVTFSVLKLERFGSVRLLQE